MPNHCGNTLKVTGDPEDIRGFREFARSDEKHLTIRNFVPMPREIQETSSPNMDEELARKMTEAHGAPDWYEWAYLNWGTKWDVYDVHLDELTEDRIEYHFTTAWSPFGDKVLEAMSGKFPSLTLELEYEEPGIGFMGRQKATNGEITEDHQEDMDPEDTDPEDTDPEE